MSTKLNDWIGRARGVLTNGLPYTSLFLLPGGSLAVVAVWLASRAKAIPGMRR
jgi:hypothetical protein